MERFVQIGQPGSDVLIAEPNVVIRCQVGSSVNILRCSHNNMGVRPPRELMKHHENAGIRGDQDNCEEPRCLCDDLPAGHRRQGSGAGRLMT
jgi:hypothetical protein